MDHIHRTCRCCPDSSTLLASLEVVEETQGRSDGTWCYRERLGSAAGSQRGCTPCSAGRIEEEIRRGDHEVPGCRQKPLQLSLVYDCG